MKLALKLVLLALIIAFALLVAWAVVSRDMPDLEPWPPVELDQEFVADDAEEGFDFAAYLESGPPALSSDRVRYRQVPLWLTDQELDALARSMAAAIEEHLDNRPTPGRRRHFSSWASSPPAPLQNIWKTPFSRPATTSWSWTAAP